MGHSFFDFVGPYVILLRPLCKLYESSKSLVSHISICLFFDQQLATIIHSLKKLVLCFRCFLRLQDGNKAGVAYRWVLNCDNVASLAHTCRCSCAPRGYTYRMPSVFEEKTTF